MSVTITDARTARKLIQKLASGKHASRAAKDRARYYAVGPDDEVIAVANNILATLPENFNGLTRDQRAARLLMDIKAKNRHINSDCRCRECGTHLSAPESIAAGIGPECASKR